MMGNVKNVQTQRKSRAKFKFKTHKTNIVYVSVLHRIAIFKDNLSE